jgi:hypothetical protein
MVKMATLGMVEPAWVGTAVGNWLAGAGSIFDN